MRHYETLFIISPEVSEDDIDRLVERYVGILEERGGFVAKVDKWGRRRLAYEVKKFRKGYYVLFDYGAEPAAVAEMERNFKIDEKVIRYLTVKQDDHFDLEAAQAARQAAEEEAARKAEEEAARKAEAEAAAAQEAAESADSARPTPEAAPAEETAAEPGEAAEQTQAQDQAPAEGQDQADKE
jgi:small subunit ribosomal protein S6